MCYCFHSLVGFARKQYCINFIYRNQTLSLKKSTSAVTQQQFIQPACHENINVMF